MYGMDQYAVARSIRKKNLSASAAVAWHRPHRRLGITTTLTASDLTALRFAVAGVVLFPVVLRRGLAFSRLGWPGFMAVVIGAGFPVRCWSAPG